MECSLSAVIFRSGLRRWCRSTCRATWTPRTCTWDDGIRSCISWARAELAEDKSPSFGQLINNHSSRAGGCSSWRICLSWLPYPPNNSKLSWYRMSVSWAAIQNLDDQIWESRISISTKLKLYTFILPIFLYAVSAAQWAVTMHTRPMLSIIGVWESYSTCIRLIWYYHMQNDDVDGQPSNCTFQLWS